MMIRLNLTHEEAKALSILLETIVTTTEEERPELTRALIKLDNAADFQTRWSELYMRVILRPIHNQKLAAAADALRGKIETALATMPEYIAGSFKFDRRGSKARWQWKQTDETGQIITCCRKDVLTP